MKSGSAHFSIVVKECTEVIGLTSIFTLLVSRFSMTALRRCFKSSLVFRKNPDFMEIRVTLVMPRRFCAHANFMWTMKVQIFPTSSSVFRFYRTRSGLPKFVAAFFFTPHGFVRFYYVLRFAFSVRFTLLHLSKCWMYILITVPILCVSFSETFTKNRPSRVNRFRREGAIDDIGSSSELVCRVRARYIIESNFTVKSVRRPKLCLMAV